MGTRMLYLGRIGTWATDSDIKWVVEVLLSRRTDVETYRDLEEKLGQLNNGIYQKAKLTVDVGRTPAPAM